jgi:hypothetical protein
MASRNNYNPYRVDVLGLFLAGLINTFLALFVAGIILGPGLRVNQPELMLRIEWIAEHSSRWQGGWAFWFAVTLSFAWSFFALGRHLRTKLPWSSLAIGIAIIAAAVDLVGVLINITVLPELSALLTSSPTDTLQPVFLAMESLAGALINLAAFGLYSFAGVLLLPALFGTQDYPRGLAWLGAAEWGIAAVATALLVFNRGLATGPLLISFVLYAPWVWGSAYWLWRRKPASISNE